MKEPKTMTHHDYKECWSFLREKGLKAEEIEQTGIGAWRQAKRLGFIESENWGYIPGEKKQSIPIHFWVTISILVSIFLIYFFNL